MAMSPLLVGGFAASYTNIPTSISRRIVSKKVL